MVLFLDFPIYSFEKDWGDDNSLILEKISKLAKHLKSFHIGLEVLGNELVGEEQDQV